jgi:hypothetical protein
LSRPAIGEQLPAPDFDEAAEGRQRLRLDGVAAPQSRAEDDTRCAGLERDLADVCAQVPGDEREAEATSEEPAAVAERNSAAGALDGAGEIGAKAGVPGQIVGEITCVARSDRHGSDQQEHE